MTTLSETDLKELKDFIAQGFAEVNGEIKQLNEQLKALEIGQARLPDSCTGEAFGLSYESKNQ